MRHFYDGDIEKSPRIQRLIDHLYAKMPEIEADRAVLLTESYRSTEGEPIITRRAKAFQKICEELPIIIRPEELIVGSNSQAPRGCQVFPEYSYEWLEAEFDTVEKRSADPFYISEETKQRLRSVYPYWKGKTTSELATSYMTKETLTAMEHNIFTPGNYFYNGIGHFTVKYEEVLAIGFEGIAAKAKTALSVCKAGDADYARKSHFLNAVIICCNAAITYAHRYAMLALETAQKETNSQRKMELLKIAETAPRFQANPRGIFMRRASPSGLYKCFCRQNPAAIPFLPDGSTNICIPTMKKILKRGLLHGKKPRNCSTVSGLN